LIVAHQYIEQLEETVSAAIFGNVGTMIVFRIGASDAEFLEKEFEPYIMHEDLVNLPKYKIYTKLMIDGVTSDPFQALTLPPIEMDKDGDEIMEKVIKVSRERYTTKREIVEQKILKWSGFLSEEDAIKEEVGELEEIVKEIKNDVKKEITKEIKSSNISNDTKLFNTKCDECDKEINVPFEPDGIRPVYCNDCFAKKKKEKEDCKDLKKTKSMSLEDAFKSQEKKYTENDTNEEEDDDYDPIHKER
ncbi:MAG: hypothetical protein PHG92_05370, partial [Patescibacteria group bacterium]|nr:hypothetical protein [Patescibacteria group bacterium]